MPFTPPMLRKRSVGHIRQWKHHPNVCSVAHLSDDGMRLNTQVTKGFWWSIINYWLRSIHKKNWPFSCPIPLGRKPGIHCTNAVHLSFPSLLRKLNKYIYAYILTLFVSDIYFNNSLFRDVLDPHSTIFGSDGIWYVRRRIGEASLRECITSTMWNHRYVVLAT